MKAQLKRGVAAAAVTVSVLAAVVGGGGSSAAQPSGLRAFGISADGTLMATFTTDRPQVLDWVRTIQGFSGDTAAIGLDHRVQDGQMYLVGNYGGIYKVKINAPNDPVVTKVSQLTVALHGTDQLVLTLPFVLYGMFRYIFLLHRHGGGGDPAAELLGDAHLIVAVLGWLALTLWLLV